jgi:hypothetical protein
MKSKLKRLAAGLVATTIVGVTPLLMATPASAAPVNAGPAVVTGPGGTGTVNSGDSTTDFSIRFGAGPFPDGPDAGTTPDTVATCTKDGTDNGRAHSYMIPGNQSPATDLFFGGTGAIVADGSATGASVGTGGTGTFKNNLRVAGSTTQLRNIPLNAGDAAILMSSNLDFSGFTAGQIPSGTYNIGIDCIDISSGDGTYEPTNYWNRVITVTYPGGPASGAEITWGIGTVVTATLGTITTDVVGGVGELTAPFTPVGTSETPVSYTVTATPTGGGAPGSATGSASPLTVTGLTPNATYDVTVTATNAAGSGAPSAPSSVTINDQAQPPVTNIEFPGAEVPGTTEVDVTWDAPTGGEAVTGYDIDVVATGGTPAFAGSVAHTGTATTATISGLEEAGSYSVTITPLHGGGFVAAPASSSFQLVSGLVLVQEITATRPDGALIITQKCGPLSDQAPLTDHDDNPATPMIPDPEFAEYPYPSDPNYPTICGVDLGTAVIDPSGAYYVAEGDIAQITVSDTRDTDPGWTVTGTMGDFEYFDVDGTTVLDTFSGSQLGWTPVVTGTTPTYTNSAGVAYTQTVLPGSPVAPGAQGSAGLSAGQILGSAALGTATTGGIGVAVLDAPIVLHIPATADPGEYVGVLTITAS